jgi:hypothetical protein
MVVVMTTATIVVVATQLVEVLVVAPLVVATTVLRLVCTVGHMVPVHIQVPTATHLPTAISLWLHSLT